MSTQNYESYVLFPRRQYAGLRRSTIIIAFCAILGLVGSLTLSVAFSSTGSQASSGSNASSKSSTTFYTTTQWSLAHAVAATPQSQPTSVAHAVTATPQSQPTSGTATPVQTNTNSTLPITPFPTLLWQEIAALQTQNRFLYDGNPSLPEVALTFDDGPNPYYTQQVLAVLQQYGIKATFFCIGRQVAEYPWLVQQEYAAGNVIGNHTWSHPDLTKLSSDDILTQINTTSDAIQQAIGVRPTFFRPPYGVFNANVLTQANQLGLTTIIWNDEARDWTTPGISVISSRILGLAGNGAIILLHDGGGNRSQTVAALPTIITSLRQQGYTFVTLPQMVHDLPLHPASTMAPISMSMPTVVYSTATETPTAFVSSIPSWKQGL